MVGDLEHAAKTVGIGFVDRVDVDRGERHPRMGGLVPGIEAAEDDHAIVTRLPVVQLDLEMVFRAASLHAFAELVLEVVGRQGLAGSRLLEPRRAQIGWPRNAGLRSAILGQQAELAVAQPAVARAELERRLAVVVELREGGRAQAERNRHVLEAARVVLEIGNQVRPAAAHPGEHELRERVHVPERCGDAAVHQQIERTVEVGIGELERGPAHDHRRVVHERNRRMPQPAREFAARPEEIGVGDREIVDDADAPAPHDAVMMRHAVPVEEGAERDQRHADNAQAAKLQLRPP